MSTEPAAGDEEPTGPPTARGPWSTVLVVALAVALVASVTVAVLTLRDVRDRQDAASADRSALSAGRSAAVAFTTYDYRHLDKDLTKVTERATGSFRTEFTSALGALTQAIKQAKGVSTGEVTYAGLLRRKGDSAVVLAAVDAAITNAQTAKPSTRRYRLQITLDRSSGAWLISNIEAVS